MRVWRWWRSSVPGRTALPALTPMLLGVGATASALALMIQVLVHPSVDGSPLPTSFAIAALVFLAILGVLVVGSRGRQAALQPPQPAPILRFFEMLGLALLVPFYWHLLRELPSGIETGEIAPVPFLASVLGQ